MAKTRRPRPAKKRSSSKSKRPKPASKPAKRASVKSPKKAVKAVQKVELKELRKQFASVLAVLSTRRTSSPETEARLDNARQRISQWMTDIDDICTPEDHEICGPDMAFPLS